MSIEECCNVTADDIIKLPGTELSLMAADAIGEQSAREEQLRKYTNCIPAIEIAHIAAIDRPYI